MTLVATEEEVSEVEFHKAAELGEPEVKDLNGGPKAEDDAEAEAVPAAKCSSEPESVEPKAEKDEIDSVDDTKAESDPKSDSVMELSS